MGVAKHLAQTRPTKSTKVSAAKIRDLRAQAKTVRQQVARDREQIAAEARAAVEEPAENSQLKKLTLLLRADEQPVLDALDRYAAEHGFKSRNQVLRAALAHLLNIDLNQPHWGWPAGKSRASDGVNARKRKGTKR